ncbi:winged helix-turn-helix transcriptional regulator [Enterobacter sp. Ap-916]|uniref:ArsR/SmtB family transcription factor n=1 Tax=Enterobacteriaceae TaxID=543 RepID=UPI000272ABDC|nr:MULTISPECIES: winged helix-turn-helix domain-containing protein [Enterobacteriaceae]EJF30432.1 regulatory protein ArsR [Enterobacter sp. Ag1]NIF58074.1 winged helix-turn-helix transcriptional regulator [Enterobacter sp. Ap-867]NIG27984.1 winged helix-turn-helix transcriptional regulator [Enterobacter sp. Ap-916]
METDFLETRLAAVAAAIADKTRASMLCALMDGRAWTATELSIMANVAPSTASSHLAKLMEQSLIACVQQGRHRYYRLHSSQIAGALEGLMGLVGRDDATMRTKTPGNLRYARTCYDHMAGEIAVALHDALFRLRWLEGEEYVVTARGEEQLLLLGVNVESGASRRRYACGCLDWSERREHLGGQLGKALLHTCEQKGWMRRDLVSRELHVSESGKRKLAGLFGVAF